MMWDVQDWVCSSLIVCIHLSKQCQMHSCVDGCVVVCRIYNQQGNDDGHYTKTASVRSEEHAVSSSIAETTLWCCGKCRCHRKLSTRPSLEELNDAGVQVHVSAKRTAVKCRIRRMPRYFVGIYNKRTGNPDDVRYAAYRQDGSSKRILKQDFLTEEGAHVWLTNEYIRIKSNKPRTEGEASALRRAIARRDDPRRLPTAGPRSPSTTGDPITIFPVMPPTWAERWASEYSPQLRKAYKDSKQGALSCCMCRGSAGWKRSHVDWCTDLDGCDMCIKTCIPCCCIYLYAVSLEKAEIGWYRAVPCCFPCNRQLLATRYNIDETDIQSYCFHVLPCCSCLSLLQEMYEVGENEEGKICCGCHGHGRRVESAHPKVVAMRRTSRVYKFIQSRPFTTGMNDKPPPRVATAYAPTPEVPRGAAYRVQPTGIYS
jgi:hypothetical protein